MIATYEKRVYAGREKIWAGRYANLQNLPHWHYDCELIYMEEGESTITVNEHAYLLKKNKTLFLEGGELHFIRSTPDSRCILFLFDSELLQALALPALKNPLLQHEYDVPALYERIRGEIERKQPAYVLKTNTLLTELLIDIYRTEELCGREEKHETSVARFKELFAEMEKNYAEYTFQDAVDFMGFCPSYFSRLFHRIAGMTFPQYLNCLRVTKAVEFLLSEKERHTMTEIAILCGFGTIRNFNRIFKSLTGYAPSDLPRDYSFNTNSFYRLEEGFDPTMPTSVLLDA